jgi:hypothetical protein
VELPAGDQRQCPASTINPVAVDDLDSRVTSLEHEVARLREQVALTSASAGGQTFLATSPADKTIPVPPQTSAVPAKSLRQRVSPGSITASLGLAGLVLYGILYSAGLIFYGKFGVDPAEVGFTKEAALAHASFGVLTILVAIPFIFPFNLLVLVMWIKRRRVLTFLQRHVIFARRIVVATAIVIPGIAFWVTALYAEASARTVISGKPPETDIVILKNVTGISIAVGDATWTLPAKDGPIVYQARVALLGQIGPTAVVYDYAAHMVIHIPAGSFTFRHDLPP